MHIYCATRYCNALSGRKVKLKLNIPLIFAVISQMSHWPCVKLAAHTVGMSAIEASQKEHDETETVSAMASLSMQQPTNLTLVSVSLVISDRCGERKAWFTHAAIDEFCRTTPEHSREVSEEPMEQDEAK